MKVGIMQPYFMPYIGYFQLMKAVDKYVVYDDVNYINKGWINRNRILIGQEAKLFTIPLAGASQKKRINEIFIADNFVKLQKTLRMNYSKAPFFKDVMHLFDAIFAHPDKQLALFILHSFRVVLEYLDIKTDFILSSCIEKDNSLKGQNKILTICKELEADTYINAIGGQDLYDRNIFNAHGIELKFLRPKPVTYVQFRHEFVPNLSMIDVLMFNSPEKIVKMLDAYEFI